MRYAITKTQQAAIDAALTRMQQAQEAIEAAVTEYNAALDDARAIYGDLARTFREQFDDSSERWQESERGEAVSEWLDRLDEVAELEDIDEPDTGEAITAIEGMDTEPGQP